MPYLALAGLFLGGILIVLAIAPLPPEGRTLRQALAGRRGRAPRPDERWPLFGAPLARARRGELHRAVRDRLPAFWGDLAIYLAEGRCDLRGAVLAAIERRDDPLSEVLQRHLQATHLGRLTLAEALLAAAAEVGYRPFTTGVRGLLSTAEIGGDLRQLLEVLRDQAMDRYEYERESRLATLETRLIVVLWPILFLALMLAIFVPIGVSALGAL